MRVWFVLCGIIALPALACPSAPAQGRAACSTGINDDTLRPLPPALTAKVAQLFGLANVPEAQVRRSTVVRCMDGHLMACNYGANLPCGKANASRVLPAADEWCQQNPEADFIPAYISGHDSIYLWRCAQGRPATLGAPAALDKRGFLSAYWKVIQ